MCDRVHMGMDSKLTSRDGLQNLWLTDAIVQAAKTGQAVETA